MRITPNNNNFSVLPIYSSIEEQDSRKAYAYGDIYAYNFPINYVPPFQMQLVGDAITIADVAVSIVNYADGSETDITTELTDTGLTIVEIDGKQYLAYPSNLPLVSQFDCGRYYLKITVDGTDFFSEIWTMCNDTSGCIKIEWSDTENLNTDCGTLIYRSNSYVFKHYVYLHTELGKPEYAFEEDGEERDGYYFPIKQVSKKVYKCTFLAPEYLCDLLRFAWMSDYVIVTDNYNRKYRCDTFLITPKWQVQGNLAAVECEFTTNTAVKKVAKLSADMGDYNVDFNNDYDI